MNNITVDVVRVDARKGIRTDAAVREALILALTEMRKVELHFNGMSAVLDPEILVTQGCMSLSDGTVTPP